MAALAVSAQSLFMVKPNDFPSLSMALNSITNLHPMQQFFVVYQTWCTLTWLPSLPVHTGFWMPHSLLHCSNEQSWWCYHEQLQKPLQAKLKQANFGSNFGENREHFLKMPTEEKSIHIIEFLGKKSEWKSWSEKFCHRERERDTKASHW